MFYAHVSFLQPGSAIAVFCNFAAYFHRFTFPSEQLPGSDSTLEVARRMTGSTMA
jgi:hypothetical protein